MYSDQEVREELRITRDFLKKYDAEYTLIYIEMRMKDYDKSEGDL